MWKYFLGENIPFQMRGQTHFLPATPDFNLCPKSPRYLSHIIPKCKYLLAQSLSLLILSRLQRVINRQKLIFKTYQKNENHA